MLTPSKILAHRGFSAQYPENTRIAFRKALELPIDGLEFDVHLTKDEVPVVIHDATVNRTTDGEGAVSTLTLSELRAYNAGHQHSMVGFQPVPTLEEVLDIAYGLHPDGLYNIEIKGDGDNFPPLVDAVMTLVNRHPIRNNILVSSFCHESLRYLKERFPKYPIGLLFEEDVREPWYIAQELGAYSVHLNHQFVTNDVVRECHQHGIGTAVWTVDDAQTIERFLKMPVDVLITNVPNVAADIKQRL